MEVSTYDLEMEVVERPLVHTEPDFAGHFRPVLCGEVQDLEEDGVATKVPVKCQINHVTLLTHTLVIMF